MADRLVVVGGDAAGMSAASQARRRRRRADPEITAFERGEHTSYSACGIPYFVGGDVAPLGRLVVRTPGQTLGDGAALDAELRRAGVGRAVVVGGGYIGLEMAEALVRRGVGDVTLVEADAEPMPTLDADMGALVRAALEDVGVTVRTATGVDAFEAGAAGRVRTVIAGSEAVAADIVILGLGVRPASGLATDAGSRQGRRRASAPTAACGPRRRTCGPPATASRCTTA